VSVTEVPTVVAVVDVLKAIVVTVVPAVVAATVIVNALDVLLE
jgi:hypothetical protein